MMEPDIEICKTIAIRHGLPLQYVIKEFHVFAVLSRIASMGSEAVFKGGTALNKVYLGGVQRFSEDLDFDLEASLDVKSWCHDAEKTLEGYQISQVRKVRDTLQFDCVYTWMDRKDHIRVDISPKKIITSRPIAIKSASSAFSGSSVAGIRVYAIEDLMARKLNALATRCEGKDVFDVSNGLPLCGEMEDAISRMLESEGKAGSAGDFMERAVRRLKGAEPAKLRNLTNPFIPSSVRPEDWFELRDDLVIRLERLNG